MVTMTCEPAAPAAQRRTAGWGARQTLAAAAVAVVIGGLGGAAIYAATATPPRVIGAHGGPPGGPQGQPMPPARPTPAGALHSEYVVADGHGGFTTMLTQTGTVDQVTPSSVAVRSDDGYTQTYQLPPGASGATGSVQVNDVVIVDATRTGPAVILNRIENGPARGK